ncbi:Rpn family recombination-promoting nuclease/putative transposase [Lachnoanaerobaculum umeaense]|uniref:Transposase n=1 Tax=Lachnoanaerobaculum umeaense TaxID=617123 RepID=A0A385Q293_9FIRM|nr:Rpn family recombination-promoting nuclease/putative transposase [Lachnoanaerobaculum umeaense]AYA98663.1 transposase [Lachnoanaerobaculum umeaense]
MQDKDITQKVLEKYNDVFADILNVLLFDGRNVVEESALIDALPMSMLKIDGRVRSQERDIAKYWRKSKIKVTLFGLENQTIADRLMPLRVFGYDGAEYVKQSRKENSDKAKYPVITLVLYLGYEKRWNYPKTLFEVLDIDEDIKPYVNDFKINLFEIAYLDREKIDLFKSDFRILADYLYQMRVNRDYIADETTIEHVEELLTLMSAMTGDNRFEETINELKGKENINMCEVLDRVEARGIEKGIEQGIEKGRMEGRQEGIINILISLVNDGILSVYEAASRADMSVEDFKKYINKN